MPRTPRPGTRPAIVTLADLAPQLDITGGSGKRVFGMTTGSDDAPRSPDQSDRGEDTLPGKRRGDQRQDQ
jgi:hypothetical protein